MIVGLSSFPDQANALLTATLDEVWSSVARLVS